MTTLPDTLKKAPWGVLPFRIRLSFEQIFAHWEEMAQSEQIGKAGYAKEVLRTLEEYPVLRQPIDDYSILKDYEEPIRLLLSPIFPEALASNEIKSAGLPFTNLNFNPSARFAKILEDAGPDFELDIRDFDDDMMYLYACIFILNTSYGTQIDFKRPYFFDIPDKGRGITKHYRVFYNGDFATFKIVDKNFKLSKEDIRLLTNNFGNIDLWKQKIPPNTFDFEGIGILTIFDVSTDEVLSALKEELLSLRPDAVSKEILENIEAKFQTIFNIPELKFGFAYLDEDDGTMDSLNHNFSTSLIMGDLCEVSFKEGMCEGAQEMLCNSKETMIVADIENNIETNPLFEGLLDQGIKSYMMSPIMVDDKVVGILELGAPNTNELNSVVANKLQDLLPIFTVAARLGAEDYKTKLEAIVQEKFTSIHPSVSWRFFDVAEQVLIARQEGEESEIEEIVFENIYPLYGQSDIKGSSTERNLAIQSDLIEQLKLARKVLREAAKVKDLPIYQQLSHRIQQCTAGVKKGLNAGDEVGILEFLKTEVYPVFNHLQTRNPKLRQLVDDYTSVLDPELGVVYKRRKDYEQSVAMINDKIAAYIDQQQSLAQEMFPHYYEKYKTDGVEYNIYIGDALVKNQDFDPMYLHNLRLWQLLTMCGVENKMHQLKPHLKVPLEVASLILIHSSPLTIKFRMTEKRFDVDGAYNVRYEIVKKRIDKALVKGKNERLTLPGKIAIVYSQEKDAIEYRKYLEYLQSRNMIGPVIESLELDELQGASGLKALRVDVVYESDFGCDLSDLPNVELAKKN